MKGFVDRATACGEERIGVKRFLLRELPADIGWCFAIAAVLTLLFAPLGDVPWSKWGWALLWNLVITLCIGLTVGNLYRFAYPRLLPRVSGSAARMTLHVLLIGGGVAFGVEISARVLAMIGATDLSEFRGNALQIGLVIASLVVLLSIAYEQLRDRARRDELRLEQAQQEALRARLEALQARTHPHFLFNSLNTVAGLIEEDPAAAERVLERLSSLFRYSLEGSHQEWVRLAEELEAVQTYLDVEAIRLGDRLQVTIDVDEGAREVLVPPLVLQPLVENAILHGIASVKEGGEVRVKAERNGSRLDLSVDDNGPGPGHSPHRGSGSSLADLEKRLELIYGGRARMSTEAAAGGGYRIRLSLPCEAAG